jgi:uncharacterized coiled-coil protein SlyX
VGNELTDGERMVRMETEMSSIKDTVLELKTMLTELSKRDEKYVKHDVLDEKMKSVEKDMQGIQKQINEIKEEKKTHKNILPIWLAIVPSIVLVIIEILKLTGK